MRSDPFTVSLGCLLSSSHLGVGGEGGVGTPSTSCSCPYSAWPAVWPDLAGAERELLVVEDIAWGRSSSSSSSRSSRSRIRYNMVVSSPHLCAGTLSARLLTVLVVDIKPGRDDTEGGGFLLVADPGHTGLDVDIRKPKTCPPPGRL